MVNLVKKKIKEKKKTKTFSSKNTFSLSVTVANRR